MIVAVDGTAGSGKGSLALILAKKFNLSYLDTGKLYRIIAYKLNVNKIKENFLKKMAIKFSNELNSTTINKYKPNSLINNEISKLSSLIAVIPEVRKGLLQIQRDFANNYPSNKSGAILDGRDIGSIVLPNANIKFFLDATVEIRAKRRSLELIEKGNKVIYTDILKNLIERDTLDKNRKFAPLKKQTDSVYINTSYKTLEEVAYFAIKKIDSFIEKRKNYN